MTAPQPAPAFEPIAQWRAHEYVAEQIRRQIGLRLIPTGGSLPSERDLAALFGVGRATVQQAVRLLEAERLVESRRGRHGGTFVIAPSSDDLAMDYLLVRLRRDAARIEEALVFRGHIETVAAELAATTRRKAELREVVTACARAESAESDVDFMMHDTQFHLAVARAGRNRFVTDAVERLRLVLNDALTALPDSDLWHERSRREHIPIRDAIEARDGAAAGAAMAEHLASTERSIHALLVAL